MDSLPSDCDALVFRFLTLRDLLTIRGCSRALRVRYDPQQRPHVWRAVRPKGAIIGTRTSLECARILHRAYAITRTELSEWGTLGNRCRLGDLPAARWLVELFALTADDARAFDDWALRGACDNGHLEIAQWLAATFSLTSTDARACDNWALRYACARGHLAVARWLVSHFKLTLKDIRSLGGDALSRARAHGHSDVVAWLESRRRG